MFIASFLVLAGAAVIIGSMANSSTRLIILLVITAVFYLAGIIIHIATERLRPAALALTSTGLALIPFTGIAFYYFVALPGPTAWLIMSAIGLVANIVATYVLRNQVVSYIAIAFIFSLLCSLVATVAVGIVWYFVILIFISMLCSLISLLKPSLLPKIFVTPIEHTGRFVTPAAVICSLFLVDYATAPMYSVVFSLAAVHYLIEYIKTKKPLPEIFLRILTQVATICIVSDIFAINPFYPTWWMSSLSPIQTLVLAITIFATSVLQLILSIVKIKKRNDTSTIYQSQIIWIVSATFIAFISPIVMARRWEETGGNLFLFIVFCTIGILSVYIAISVKKTAFAYLSLAYSIVAIIVLARGVISPAIPWQIIVSIFLALAVILLLYYHKQRAARSKAVNIFLKVSLLTYLGFSLIALGILTDGFARQNLYHDWVTIFEGAILIACALLLFVLSTIENKLVYIIISFAALYFGLTCLVFGFAPSYLGFVLSTTAGALVFGAGALYYHRRGDTLRRNTAFIAAVLVVASLLLSRENPIVTALIAGVVVSAVAALLSAISVLKIGKGDTIFKWLAVTCSLVLCLVSAGVAIRVDSLLCAVMFLFFAVLAYIYVVKLRIQWLISLSIPSLMIALFFVPMNFVQFYITKAAIVFGITAVVSYILYHINLRLAPDNKFRSNVFFAFTMIYLGLAAGAATFLSSPYEFVPITILLAISVILFVRGHKNAQERYMKEIGLYLGTCAAILYLDLFSGSIYNGLFAVHIAAVAVWVSIWILHAEGKERFARRAIAAAILAAGTGITAVYSTTVIPSNAGISFALFLYFAVLIYLFSERFRIPWLIILSLPSLMGALFFLPWNTATTQTFPPILFAFIITAVVSYFLYIINLRRRKADVIRTNILYGFSVLYLLLTALAPSILSHPTENIWQSVASATALLATGAILWIRGRRYENEYFLKEIGLYLGAGAIIRYTSIFISGSFDGVIAAHIMAAALIVSALLMQKEGTGRVIRLAIALSIITVGTITQAIASELLFFQILFLVEMILLLVIGVLRNKQWMIYWGGAGTILAILYYLRNYTWMMLIFLGILLITFVIWRLMKISKRKN